MNLEEDLIVIKGVSCNQNNKTFYMCSIKSRIIKEMCFITRRGEDEGGFQRLLSKGRANAIKEYLDEDKGVIPTPLILSAQNSVKFKFDKKSGKISFNQKKDGFLIIDGQHRLYGLNLAENEYEVPVVIFSELTKAMEVNLFIDINTTQKGVPAALLIDLKEMTGKETSIETRQRELFDWLNSTPPMAGLLSSAKSSQGKISRKAFNDATEKIYESGFFASQDETTIGKSLVNYLNAVEKAFILSNNPEARLNKTVIFTAIMNNYLYVIDRCLSEFNNLKTESFYNIVEPISVISYEKYKGSNKQTISDITKELKQNIDKKIKITEDMF